MSRQRRHALLSSNRLQDMMGARNLGRMLDEEVTRLSEPYLGEARPEEAGLLRVAGPSA